MGRGKPLAYEQALLFGRAKRVSRERASERPLARLASLAQIGELERRRMRIKKEL